MTTAYCRWSDAGAPGPVFEPLNQASVTQLLNTHTLDAWFPRCIDKRGGFQQNFDRAWHAKRDDVRHLVFQARMLWVAATVARTHESAGTEFSAFALHGEQALACFEDQSGGGWWPSTQERRYKHSYAISFAIYALAAAYRLNPDDSRRQRLRRGLDWWDRHALSEDGTYWDVLDPAGVPMTEAALKTIIPTAPSLRSSNTYIHIIEALTEVVEARGSALAEERLLAHVEALEMALVQSRGRLYESYTREWYAADARVSFGHNIEIVTLLYKANQALQRESRFSSHATAERVRRHGLDPVFGGVCTGPFWSLRGNHRKLGWAQIEALCGFLLTAYLCKKQGDTKGAGRYRVAAEKTWRFIHQRLVDPLHPGVFDGTDRRGHVQDHRKGHQWKACYHYTRCLLECMWILEEDE